MIDSFQYPIKPSKIPKLSYELSQRLSKNSYTTMSELPPLRPQAPEPRGHSSFDPRRPRAPLRLHLQVEADNTANDGREQKALLAFYYQSFEKIGLVLTAILDELRDLRQEIGRGNVSSIESIVEVC